MQRGAGWGAVLIFFMLVFPVWAHMPPGKRDKIISLYTEVLEKRKYSAARESDLPYPREIISAAILEEISVTRDRTKINSLEAAYLELESFVSERDFNVIREYEEALSRSRKPLSPHLPSAYAEVREKIVDGQKLRLEELKRLRDKRKKACMVFRISRIHCKLEIPEGYRKADRDIQGRIESFRLSFLPDKMPLEEKRKKARLEAVFYRQLNQLRLPSRPFFTIQVHDIGRTVTESDFERQIALAEELAGRKTDGSDDRDPVKMIDYILSETPLIDQEKHSMLLSHESKLFEGDPEGYFLMQSFNYYKTGYIVIDFYSNIRDIRQDVEDLKAIVNSVEFGKGDEL